MNMKKIYLLLLAATLSKSMNHPIPESSQPEGQKPTAPDTTTPGIHAAFPRMIKRVPDTAPRTRDQNRGLPKNSK